MRLHLPSLWSEVAANFFKNNCSKICIAKLAILAILSTQFRGINCIYIVTQPSPPTTVQGPCKTNSLNTNTPPHLQPLETTRLLSVTLDCSKCLTCAESYRICSFVLVYVT